MRTWLHGALLALLLAAGYPYVAALFERRPVAIVGTPTGELMPNGRWRVTRTIDIREACGSFLVDRLFLTPGPKRVQHDAVASSEGTQLPGTAVGTRPPGRYTDWFEYEVTPGEVGSYTVMVSAGWCPSGFSNFFTLFSIPYSWLPVEPPDEPAG